MMTETKKLSNSNGLLTLWKLRKEVVHVKKIITAYCIKWDLITVEGSRLCTSGDANYYLKGWISAKITRCSVTGIILAPIILQQCHISFRI